MPHTHRNLGMNLQAKPKVLRIDSRIETDISGCIVSKRKIHTDY